MDLKDQPVPIPLMGDGLPPTGSGCPGSHPTFTEGSI